MIAITSESGAVLKVLPEEEGKVVGFHPYFGFTSKDSLIERQKNRERHGFKPGLDAFQFDFTIRQAPSAGWEVTSPRGCQIEKANGEWIIRADKGTFKIHSLNPEVDVVTVPERDEEERKSLIFSSLISLLIPAALLLMPRTSTDIAPPEIIEQVTVQINKEVQKPVTVPSALDKIAENVKHAESMKRAIKQDLGFLGLLGKKDLTKAVGGAPTSLKDASPGAGPGGKEGSGGEFLVGLGEGLKRVTVGNTGVAGLGGMGTKGGPGGGAGGYGNSMIGSGDGKALSTVPLSQDVVLEGGLEKSVVQATIAKYLSQVRACYEQGLKANPGLGGLVTMSFEVSGTGTLNFANVQKSTLGNNEVESCISQKMLTWKFPNPRGGVNVKVVYPFLLRSARG